MTFIDLEYGIDQNWQNLSPKPSEHKNTNDSNEMIAIPISLLNTKIPMTAMK